MTIRNGEVHKSRFSKGIYVKYRTKAEEEYTVTDTKVNTLSPEFNCTKIFSIPKVTQETLEWFDSGCITFLMYGRQEDAVADPRLTKMTTKVTHVPLGNEILYSDWLMPCALECYRSHDLFASCKMSGKLSTNCDRKVCIDCLAGHVHHIFYNVLKILEVFWLQGYHLQ